MLLAALVAYAGTQTAANKLSLPPGSTAVDLKHVKLEAECVVLGELWCESTRCCVGERMWKTCDRYIQAAINNTAAPETTSDLHIGGMEQEELNEASRLAEIKAAKFQIDHPGSSGVAHAAALRAARIAATNAAGDSADPRIIHALLDLELEEGARAAFVFLDTQKQHQRAADKKEIQVELARHKKYTAQVALDHAQLEASHQQELAHSEGALGAPAAQWLTHRPKSTAMPDEDMVAEGLLGPLCILVGLGVGICFPSFRESTPALDVKEEIATLLEAGAKAALHRLPGRASPTVSPAGSVSRLLRPKEEKAKAALHGLPGRASPTVSPAGSVSRLLRPKV
jgi:hypothetical protein